MIGWPLGMLSARASAEFWKKWQRRGHVSPGTQPRDLSLSTFRICNYSDQQVQEDPLFLHVLLSLGIWKSLWSSFSPGTGYQPRLSHQPLQGFCMAAGQETQSAWGAEEWGPKRHSANLNISLQSSLGQEAPDSTGQTHWTDQSSNCKNPLIQLCSRTTAWILLKGRACIFLSYIHIRHSHQAPHRWSALIKPMLRLRTCFPR